MHRKPPWYLVGCAVMLLALASLGGCQTAPVTASQRGPEATAEGGVTPTAPVDQHGVLIVAPTVVFAGATADGKVPGITITVGPQANGDVKGSGRLETGPQTDSKTLTQTSTPTQTNDLSGVLKAAEDFLATVNPASDAGKLAQAAVEAAKSGKVSEAKATLDKAKAASTAPPAPGSP